MLPDRDLVDRACARDREAFAALVARYQRLVVGVALAITRDRALAEDIGQDTFVAAWKSLGALDDREKPAPWLAGIARNLANNAVRKASRRSPLEPTTDVDLAPSQRERLELDERAELLRQTLDELPDAQREVLVLYYFEDRSVEHVAAGLGVSRDVVKQRLHRAREAARVRLTERLESTLESARPSVAFAGAVIAAIALLPVTEATAATTSAAKHTGGKMMLTKFGIAAAILAAAGGTTLYAVNSRGQSPAKSTPSAAAQTHAMARIVTPDDRARLAAAIEAARMRRTTATPTTAPAHADADIPPEYLARAVGAISPLLMECLGYSLATHAVTGNKIHSDGKSVALPPGAKMYGLDGKPFTPPSDSVFSFSMADGDADAPPTEGYVTIGVHVKTEPDVGAVITSSEIIDDKSTITDPQIRECLRETMNTIELDPAQVGGEAEFTAAVALGGSALDKVLADSSRKQ